MIQLEPGLIRLPTQTIPVPDYVSVSVEEPGPDECAVFGNRILQRVRLTICEGRRGLIVQITEDASEALVKLRLDDVLAHLEVCHRKATAKQRHFQERAKQD